MENSTKGLKRIQVVSVQMVKEKNVYYASKSINCPKDGADILRQFIGNADRELFVVACLDIKNQVMSLTVAHMGSLNASIVHPREVFKTAILSNAASILVAHNHPSGNPDPSPEDIEVAHRLQKCGDLLGIELIDALTIGEEGRYVSLKERNLLLQLH